MEDRLKGLLQELGNAINDSLSDSDKISAAVGEIRQAGYDIFLVLEATIGFNKREYNGEGVMEEGEEETGRSIGGVNITSEDLKFLKNLKINLD